MVTLKQFRRERTNANIVVSVMSGDKNAYRGAQQLLELARDLQFERRVGIAFGLYGSDKPMPGDPHGRRQKDFVLSRGQFVSPDAIEWYGIAGRDQAAWRTVFDLYAVDEDGLPRNPAFVARMRKTVKRLDAPSSTFMFSAALEGGTGRVSAQLGDRLKLAACDI